MVGSSDFVVIGMRQRALDRIGMPQTGFVQQGACHCAKSMAGHLVMAIAEPPKRQIHGSVLIGRFDGVQRRKQKVTGPSEGA